MHCLLHMRVYINSIRASRPRPHTVAIYITQRSMKHISRPLYLRFGVSGISLQYHRCIPYWCGLSSAERQTNVLLVSSGSSCSLRVRVKQGNTSMLVFLCTNARGMHRGVIENRRYQVGSTTTGKVITNVASGQWKLMPQNVFCLFV